VLSDCASFLVRAEIAGQPRRPDLWRDIADYAARWFPSSCALLRAGRADAARHLIATRRPQNGKTAFPVAGLPAHV
jgi:hypothetical protein